MIWSMKIRPQEMTTILLWTRSTRWRNLPIRTGQIKPLSRKETADRRIFRRQPMMNPIGSMSYMAGRNHPVLPPTVRRRIFPTETPAEGRGAFPTEIPGEGKGVRPAVTPAEGKGVFPTETPGEGRDAFPT